MKRFTNETKANALAAMIAGIPVKQVAKDYGTTTATLYTWRAANKNNNKNERRVTTNVTKTANGQPFNFNQQPLIASYATLLAVNLFQIGARDAEAFKRISDSIVDAIG